MLRIGLMLVLLAGGFAEAAQFRLKEFTFPVAVGKYASLDLLSLLSEKPKSALTWIEPKGMPEWLHLNTEKQTLEGTPGVKDAAEFFPLELFVFENGVPDSTHLFIEVSNLGTVKLPVWDIFPIRDYACVGKVFQNMYPWGQMAINPAGSGGKLKFSFLKPPSWLKTVISHDDVSAIGTPLEENIGENVFTLRATNAYGYTDVPVIIKVERCD